MSYFARERAYLMRWAAGLHGPVGPAAAWELRAWYGKVLDVRHDAGAVPRFQLRADGGAYIRLPLTADMRQEGLWLLEEIGHYACRGEYPGRPTLIARRATYAELRLDELREQDVEGETQLWLDTLLIPDEVFGGLQSHADAEDLLWGIGMDWELLARRQQQVTRARLGFAELPQWCAAREYEVRYCAAHGCCRILVAPEAGGEAYELPTTPRDAPHTTAQVHADLAAHTPTEFRLKYAATLSPSAETRPLPWPEMRSRLLESLR